MRLSTGSCHKTTNSVYIYISVVRILNINTVPASNCSVVLALEFCKELPGSLPVARKLQSSVADFTYSKSEYSVFRKSYNTETPIENGPRPGDNT